jgi:hypothetical protein
VLTIRDAGRVRTLVLARPEKKRSSSATNTAAKITRHCPFCGTAGVPSGKPSARTWQEWSTALTRLRDTMNPTGRAANVVWVACTDNQTFTLGLLAKDGRRMEWRPDEGKDLLFRRLAIGR